MAVFEDFDYSVIGNSIKLNQYNGNKAIVDIPDKIEDKPVMTIGGNCFYNKRKLEEVRLPNELRIIEIGAFEKCIRLKTISFPPSLRAIRNSAFSGCNALKEIVITEGVATLGHNAFTSCSSLERVVLPNSIEATGNEVFYKCPSLKSVIFPCGNTWLCPMFTGMRLTLFKNHIGNSGRESKVNIAALIDLNTDVKIGFCHRGFDITYKPDELYRLHNNRKLVRFPTFPVR